jgi:hypothetical protein
VKFSVWFVAAIAFLFSGSTLQGQEAHVGGISPDALLDALALQNPSEKPADLKDGADLFHHDTDVTSSFNAPRSNRPDFAAKAEYFAYHSFGPGAIVGPLFWSALELARPPAHFPKDWRQGAGAFGRLYCGALAFQTAAQTGRFLTGAAFHEDPRYWRSSSLNPFARAMHAIAFTAFGKSDSGHTTLALSNFVASASAGFVGNAYLPRGYSDTTHAVNRMGIEFGSLAITNLAEEFTPEFRRLGNRLRLPGFMLPSNSNN